MFLEPPPLLHFLWISYSVLHSQNHHFRDPYLNFIKFLKLFIFEKKLECDEAWGCCTYLFSHAVQSETPWICQYIWKIIMYGIIIHWKSPFIKHYYLLGSYASWQEASYLTCHLTLFTKRITIHVTMDAIREW